MTQTSHEARLVPARGGGLDGDEALAAVGRWLATPSLRSLVKVSGGDTALLDAPVPDAIDWLAGFSAVWDFRSSGERTQGLRPQIAIGLADTTRRAAADLGLLVGGTGDVPRPRRSSYDHVVVPGGKLRACLVRNAGAAHLLSSGVGATAVAALGSFRTPLLPEETRLAEEFGLEVDSEFDAMDLGLRRAYGLGGLVPEVRSSEGALSPTSWRVHRYERGDTTLTALAAPSSEPEVRPRANTPDTYAWWAREVAQLGPADSVLVVTSQIYVPFQHTDAVRMLALPFGCSVETWGVPAGITAGLPPQQFEPYEYLQEIRSAALSMQRLVHALGH